ncbi:MAG: hypothetical protein V4565_10020 [Bacteroidota bacterium]
MSSQNSLSKLEGSWYVNMSNFKMWLTGSKVNPKFNYTIQTKGNIVGLKDVVSYRHNKREKTIQGFDTPLNNEATSFSWRGNGFLFLFKSKWEIVYQNDVWKVIHFEKTLVTDEGYDVISRLKNMDEKSLTEIRQKLTELGIHKELTVIQQQ